MSVPSSPTGGGASSASTGSAPTSAPSTSSSAPTSAPASSGAPSSATTATTPKAPAAAPAKPSQGQPATTPATSAQQQVERRYKAVIDGKPVELTRAEALEQVFGTLGDDEVLSLTSLRRAAHERMQAAKTEAQQAAALRQKLADRERGFSEWLALHEDKNAALQQIEREMSAEYQRSLLSPEQQELARLKSELEKRDAAEKQRAEAEKKARTQKMASQFRERFASQVREHATAVGLPTSPQIVAAFAAHAEQSLRAGVPVDVAAIARQVQREMDEGWNAFIGGLDEERLEQRLGQERIEKLIARRAAAQAAATPKPGAPVSAPARGKAPPPVAAPPRDDAGRFASKDGRPVSLEAAFRALGASPRPHGSR